MKLDFRNKKILWVFVLVLVLDGLFIALKPRPDKKTSSLTFDKKEAQIEKGKAEVFATKDKDGYGLQILARGFKNVKRVEMLVSYDYRGQKNPPLLASGTPQQNSYWAHFRFESCSRGDCLYYKVAEAQFQLALNYEDGSASDHYSTIIFSQVSNNTPITL